MNKRHNGNFIISSGFFPKTENFIRQLPLDYMYVDLHYIFFISFCDIYTESCSFYHIFISYNNSSKYRKRRCQKVLLKNELSFLNGNCYIYEFIRKFYLGDLARNLSQTYRKKNRFAIVIWHSKKHSNLHHSNIEKHLQIRILDFLRFK